MVMAAMTVTVPVVTSPPANTPGRLVACFSVTSMRPRFVSMGEALVEVTEVYLLPDGEKDGVALDVHGVVLVVLRGEAARLVAQGACTF